MDAEKFEKETEAGPPFFRTWPQMYLFVLIMHGLMILIFYIFMRFYS